MGSWMKRGTVKNKRRNDWRKKHASHCY